MTVKERLREFIKYKGISVRSFELKCGLSYGYVNNMRVSIQPDKVSNIARCFSELNTGWLLTGEGEMLKEEVQAPLLHSDMVSVSVEAWDVIKKQADSLVMKDKQMGELIDMLKKANAHPENNAGCAVATGSDK